MYVIYEFFDNMRITYGLCLDNRNIHNIISCNPAKSIKQD